MAKEVFTLSGVTDDQKRLMVFGIALGDVLIAKIRPFVEQEVQREYANLQTSHNIHTQSSAGRLKNWPTFLKYQNINSNDAFPRLPRGRFDYSLFDCRVTSHVDFAKLYLEKYMAKFNAFDEHCDANAVLILLSKVPVFSLALQSAAGDVRKARNSWAHGVFSDWDPVNFHRSFNDMERLIKALVLPATFERNLLEELKDWESKGESSWRYGESANVVFLQDLSNVSVVSEKPVSHDAYSTGQCGDSAEPAMRQITSESSLAPDLLGQMFRNLQQIQRDISEINSNTELLAEFERIALDKGFVISDNEGSGNCMFYALSEQLNLVKGIKISHGELRQSIVQYLRKNPRLPDGTDLFNFIDGYRSWADYLTNMEQDGTWGDHVILYATANCYETYIRVISGQSNHRDLTVRPDGHVISINPLVLGHVHEVHYVSLQPKQVAVEIQARVLRDNLAYENVLRTGEVKVYRARIMVIGQARAGKTSLIKSLLGLPFDPEEDSTIGIDPSSFRIDVEQAKDWQLTDQNLDVSQFADELASMAARELVKKEAKVDLAVQDMPQENRSHMSQVLIDDGKTSHKDSIATVSLSPDKMEEAPFENDGDGYHKTKLPQLKIDPALPKEEFTRCLIKYLSDLNLHPDNTSKEPVVDLDLWDFAGQHLYYASHAVFLSQQAIYLLVYNLSKGLNDPAQPCVRQGAHGEHLENPNDQTNLDDLLSWLVSVSAVCPSKQGIAEVELPYDRPPVFIVGTHADEPFKNINEMNLEIQKAVCRKHYASHVIPRHISIDNTRSSSNNGVDELKEEIMKVLKQEPYMGKKIPVRWFNFEKVVKELVAINVHYLDLEQLQIIVQEVCLIKDKNDFDEMLGFYNDLGLIVKHGSTVVLRAQWLIDVFKQLITIPRYENMEPKYIRSWQQLQHNGVLQMEVARHLLSKFTQQASVPESKSVTERDILGMMERFGLIAKFADGIYFVPAQLRSPSPEDLLEKEPTSFDPCPLYIDFPSGFVPHGFFSQLVSRCICWCSKTCDLRPKLFHCAAVFFIGKPIRTHKLTLVGKKRFIKFIVKQIAGELSAEAEEVPSLVREFLEETLKYIKIELPWFSNLKCEFRVACPLCPGKMCLEHNEICTHEDCLCLLDVVKPGEQLFCYKLGKELTVPKLDEWYPQRIRLQDKTARPPVDAAAHQLGNGNDQNVCQGTFQVKQGKPTRNELIDLGEKIGEKWKTLGRRLGIEDPEIEGIEHQYDLLREKGYQMLRLWKEKEGSAATYLALCDALMRVQRKDLAEQSCYIDGHSRKRKFQDDGSGDQETEKCVKSLKTCSLGP